MARSFLDAMSGQPLHPTAAAALAASAGTNWADPQANYHEGARARQLLDAARQTVAQVVGVGASRVCFRTAGHDAAATAAGLAALGADATAQLAASAVERAVLLAALDRLRTGSARRIGVDSDARLDIDDAESVISGRPACVAVQAANIELGTRQPVRQVAELCRAAAVPLLVDATGVLGLADVGTDWSAMLAEAVGWAGPRDAAIVVAPEGRAAPEDTCGLASIIAAAAALDAVRRQASQETPRLHALTESIRDLVARDIPGAVVLGPPSDRLPQVVSVSIPDIDASLVQSELDRAGIAVGSGSACAADRTGQPSHVLTAAGLITVGNLRIGLPWLVEERAVSQLLAELPVVVTRIRQQMAIVDSQEPSSPAVQAESGVVVVDAVGLRCPGPVIKLGRAARGMPPGTIIHLHTDDPVAPLDVQAWCRMSGSTLLSQDPHPDRPGVVIHALRWNTGADSTASGKQAR